MGPTEAVVYIPGDVESHDGLYARQGVVHIERRGNRFAGVLRDWAQVLRAAAEGVVVVFAKREHCPPAANVRREFVGEATTRLVPIVQEAGAHRAGRPGQRPIGQHHGLAAPFDESPTIVLLDRRRAAMKQRNGRIPAADVVEQAARRWGFDPTSN